MEGNKYTKFSNNIWKDKQLKSNEKLVLIYLISYHNKNLGYAYPTRKQIQNDTGISENTLGKILNNLIDKGYVSKESYKSETGKNNIYFIHKYLVVKNDNESLQEPPQGDLTNQSTNNSSDNIKSDTELINKPIELSVNEKLLSDVGIQKLNSEQLEKLNKLDTDKLIKTIEIAKQNSNNINFNYLLAIYNNKNTYEEPHRNNKGQAVKGAKQQVFTGNTVKTKYHDTFNEHYKKYSPDDLEAKLLKIQNKMSFASNL